MKHMLALLVALFVAGTALADPPSLSLPTSVTGQPGAFITVPAKTTGKNVAWLAIDPGLNLFPVTLLKDTHTAVVTSGTPGTYRLLAVTAAGDEISTPAVCNVVVQGATPVPPTPGPTPGPTPPPPTPPTPAVKPAWAVVVIDNNTRTPAQGQLITSASLIQSLTQRGVTLRTLDVSDPLIASLNYGAAITAAGGAPALLVFGPGGERLAAVTLPSDQASFLAAIPGLPKAAILYCPDGK